MSPMIQKLIQIHNTLFAWLEHITRDWMLGLAARFTFFAVLFQYYINSAFTKVGDGLTGFFQISDGAYFQIVPTIIAETLDPAAVPLFPYKIIVILGTYAEFILPVLIVIGLFTRLAALGMISFVIVQSLTDIYAHSLDDKTIGAWFDRFSDSAILDQRLFWTFTLLVIVIKGAGNVSLDYLITRRQTL